jgi:hypothetical protein
MINFWACGLFEVYKKPISFTSNCIPFVSKLFLAVLNMRYQSSNEQEPYRYHKNCDISGYDLESLLKVSEGKYYRREMCHVTIRYVSDYINNSA